MKHTTLLRCSLLPLSLIIALVLVGAASGEAAEFRRLPLETYRDKMAAGWIGHAGVMRIPWIVGVSGASGTPYAKAVLGALLDAGEPVAPVGERLQCAVSRPGRAKPTRGTDPNTVGGVVRR